jgi:hypothetical protein
MTEIVLAVWLLVSFGGGRATVQSSHLTEAACREAAAIRIESEWSYAATCSEGLRRFSIERPAPGRARSSYRTTPAAVGTCTGDDAFCGRESKP